jgi:5-methylcytosine-specific restriction protein B
MTDQDTEISTKGILFSGDAFILMGQLHDNPTIVFVSDHREEFRELIQEPFRRLTHLVADELDPAIRETLETKKGVFGRFQKNDFGKGGTYDYYWGAFYPKGSKRTNDAQLFLTIDKTGITFGESIADFAYQVQKRFRKNFLNNEGRLQNLLHDVFSDQSFKISLKVKTEMGKSQDQIIDISQLSNWLQNPLSTAFSMSQLLDAYVVKGLSESELSKTISSAFNQLYPLFILATSDDPIPIIEQYLGAKPPENPKPLYSLDQCSEETGFSMRELQTWVRAIDRKKQAILYGPPGTGKTFMAEKLAAHLVSGGDGFVELVQFHPEVSYEDFIQGIRPKASDHGGLDYPVVPGRFLEFCKKAVSCQNTCVLIIDEINRANLARVFGELMYLLEYREKFVRLAAGGEFKIPDNVRIIGTMNTADRSIALVDHALRRRFAFLALYPNYDILRKFHEREKTGFNVEGLISVLKDLNQHIGDHNYFIGPSYFLRTDLANQIEDIWHMEIEPYLEEYFFDQPDKVQQFLWDKQVEKIFK